MRAGAADAAGHSAAKPALGAETRAWTRVMCLFVIRGARYEQRKVGEVVETKMRSAFPVRYGSTRVSPRGRRSVTRH